MNKNTLYIVCALIIGTIIGAVGVSSTRSNNGATNHNPNTTSLMSAQQSGSMQSTMNTMMQSMHGKTGDDFDKTFMQEMIIHHQGAIEMAQAALQSAKHDEIKQMANDIIAAQTKEIDQMKGWQKQWYNQ
jgi:uncharacterized protein (DUF305 family)